MAIAIRVNSSKSLLALSTPRTTEGDVRHKVKVRNPQKVVSLQTHKVMKIKLADTKNLASFSLLGVIPISSSHSHKED